MLRQVVFHGGLALEFGPGCELDVLSPAEAIKALCYQVKGFEAYIRRGTWKILTKKDGRKDREQTLELLPMTQWGDIHIVPVVGGEGGRGGLGKVLAGVALIAVAFAIPAALGVAMGSSIFNVGGLSLTYGQVAGVGFALALGGLAQLLAPHNKKQKQNYLFSGTANVTDEGGCVPVFFGRCYAGSVVISVGILSTAIMGGTPALPGGHVVPEGTGSSVQLTDDGGTLIVDDNGDPIRAGR